MRKLALLQQVLPGSPRLFSILLALFGAIGFVSLLHAQDDEPRQAARVRISLPIAGSSDVAIQQSIERALQALPDVEPRPVLILELRPGRGGSADDSQFERCLALARFLTSTEMSRVRTVAYLPESVTGHAVLLPLACEQIIMAPDAQLGDAGIKEKSISETMRKAYEEIAGFRNSLPQAIAVAMLDRQEQVFRVNDRQFVSGEKYEELKKAGEVGKSEKIVSAGELAIFTGRDLRLKYQLISHLAESQQQLAQQLEVPDVDLQLDYSLERDWKATQVKLSGAITHNHVQQLMRMIQSEVAHQANLVLIEIDSPGGDPVAVESLMNYLMKQPDEVRTVALVKGKAASNAAIIPFACDEIVVSTDAILGGAGGYQYTEQGTVDVRNFLIQVGEKKQRRWSAWAAMVDPQLEVANYRHKQSGLTALFCQEELQDQIAPELWEQTAVITVPGQPLELTGGQAFDLRLADAIAADATDVARRYGVSGEISQPVRTWAHQLIDALAHPALAWFFLFIGISALIMEMQAPGIGIFGFMSAVCFGFYFWSQFLSGTAGWLEVLLFVGGVGCVAIEIFVLPGFGIFGLGGGAMILASVVLASQTFIWPQTDYQMAQVPYSLANIFIVMAAIAVSLMFAKHIVPHVPYLRDSMLQPPDEEAAEEQHRREMIVDLTHLVGQTGIAQSQLVPGGKAKFGRELVNVTCETGFAPRGAEVIAVEARGNYLLVKPK
ncbi:hypothetical protein LOC68_17575 [Blastopirellula sp. JC732]|uniref:NfeD-like C-terminal domain-containing protein n=1 Tax=Blastopirellula sediminis TaxID=2894196 RepID=A0A9X1SH87_9BACT|nr:NfeD family protein [Blastopirellula sediminis]MCC9606494.1 hypothetical protein [Blastopirellula sediminis]MCC9630208.1 hypothetical protein [Blastopirellula sediminis]